MGRSSRAIVDRNNVADQPGGVIFVVGVAIALVLGLTVRGLIHPAKVRALVESAASRIHPDVKVAFESAHVSLADGVIPRLSVVIEQVKMESANPCWMAPRLYADEIRLPISLSSWLMGRSPIRQIEAGEVELRLTAARPEACDRGEAVSAVTAPSESSSPAPAVRLVRKPEAGGARAPVRSSGEIDELSIDRLIVVSEAGSIKGSLDLEKFDFLVRSAQPRVYQLKARSRLLRDRVDDLIHANILVEYKEFPEKSLDMKLYGNWREGSYTITAKADPDSEQATVVADLQHLPLSQLLMVLKRFHVVETDFEPRQSWLSFHTEAQGNFRELAKHPVTISHLKLEGDLGDMESDRLQIKSLEPFLLAPSRVEIRNLDFDRLLEFLKQPHPSPILNKVGRFAGIADVIDAKNFRLVGEHSGLEFIFSNKGRRELQVVNGLKGEIRRDGGRWKATIGQANVVQGSFRGEASISGDEELKDVSVNVRADELSVRPAVQTLMTQGGNVAPIQGQIQARIGDRKLVGLRGNVKIPHLKIEGAELDRIVFQFGDRNNLMSLTTKIDHLAVSPDSSAGRIVRTFAPDFWIKDGLLNLSSLGGRFDIQDLHQMRWSRVSAKVDSTRSTMSSDGGWDLSGNLDGSLVIRGEHPSRWSIGGSRDNPQLREEKP